MPKNVTHIFILGKSRSGKSLLRNLICTHKNTFWFSNISDRFVNCPCIPFIHRIRDMPLLGNKIKKSIIKGKIIKIIPRPSEGNIIYHKHCKFVYNRWSNAKELTKNQATVIKKIIDIHRKYTGKQFFINDESSNLQRIEQIVEIFPNAKYIHIIRDGRAVANEIIKTNWWRDSTIWWNGKKTIDWESEGREPVVLGAADWMYSVKAILNNVGLFGKNYLEVRYEDLTNFPKNVVSKILKFCELETYSKFFDLIPNKLPNYNYRYKQELTDKQIYLLNFEIADFLHFLNYT